MAQAVLKMVKPRVLIEARLTSSHLWLGFGFFADRCLDREWVVQEFGKYSISNRLLVASRMKAVSELRSLPDKSASQISQSGANL